MPGFHCSYNIILVISERSLGPLASFDLSKQHKQQEMLKKNRSGGRLVECGHTVNVHYNTVNTCTVCLESLILVNVIRQQTMISSGAS